MKFRQLFKDIFIYGVGDIALKAIAFITLPIYTRIFTPTDYGIWSFIGTLLSFLTAILALGGESAYARYFFEVKTLSEQRLITSTWVIFLALWSLGITLFCLPFTGLLSTWSFGVERYGILFTLSLLAVPVGIVNGICGQVLRNQFRPKQFTGLNALATLLSVSCSLFGVLVLKLGIVGVMGGGLVAVLLMLPIRLWVVREFIRPIFSFVWLKRLLSYGVPLVPVSLAYWIFNVSDRILLGKLSTVEQTGLYAVANNFINTLAYINSALGQAWSPHAIRVYEEQRDQAPRFFGQVLVYILLGFGVLCVGFSAFAYEGLVILSTPPFYPAAAAVGPLAFGAVAFASTQVTAIGITLSKKTHYFSLYSWLSALLNLLLNLWAIPRWGMVAASWTTALAYVSLTVAYFYTSQRFVAIDYDRGRVLKIVLLTFLFTAAIPFIPPLPLILGIIVKVGYCLVFLALLIVLQTVSPNEWQLVGQYIQAYLPADLVNRFKKA